MKTNKDKNLNKLFKTIVELSVSSDWLNAKKEWKIDSQRDEEFYVCICGKENIKNVFTLKNIKNNNMVEVGSSCVTKFLDKPKYVLDDVKKLENDMSKSVSKKLSINIKSD